MHRRFVLAALLFALLAHTVTIGPAFPAQAGEPCQGRTGESGFFNKTIDSGGMERNYILFVPTGYEPNTATSLVFNFHGLGSNALEQYFYTRMDALASEFTFILVTPNGIQNSWNAGTCCAPANDLAIDDVGFTSDMIDSISEEYCIDQDRIHATGLSNGGFMSWRLACDLSERIAAIGPVAGAVRSAPCLPSRPVSVIGLHGTADVLVPHSDGLQSVVDWAADMCTDTTEVVYAEGEVTCFAYTECLEHGRVEFCSVEGGGHTWPGSAIDICENDPGTCSWAGSTTQDIDASREIAKFFRRWYRMVDDTACNDGLDNDGDDLIDLDDPDCTDRSDPLEAPDADEDVVEDGLDNCVQVSNPGQQDTDGDDYGNACDCDFNQNLTCNIADFNVFLPDFVSALDSGIGTDMDSNGGVGIGDFNLFLPGFIAGEPGPSGLAECITEGGSRPVVPGALPCCLGLVSIPCAEPVGDICQPCPGATICADCGNGICGPGENTCNCPEDCPL